MKKYFIYFIIILTFFSYTFTTDAHESSEKGSASLLIHIDPDDVAIAKKATTIHINLSNEEKGFSLEKCDCQFSISEVTGEEETEIFKTRLVSSEDSSSIYNVQGVPFTFTDEGEYHINVTGEPTIKNLFNSFEVEVVENVLPAGTIPPQTGGTDHTHTPTHNHTYPKIMLGIAILFTVLMGYFLFSHNDTK